MASAKKIRELCLAFPDVTEGDHFGASAFKVKGKLFATLRARERDCELVFGLDPEHADLLLENDARFTRYPRAPNALVLLGSKAKSVTELRTLLRESYALAAPRKKK